MVVGILTLTIPSSWNHHRRHCLRPTPPLIKCESGGVPLTKQAHRFFSSLTSTAAVDDLATANRLIKKFVASSPKSIALNALSHLLSPRNSHPHLSAIAFPLYTKISEASWYNWNPKLVADLVPLLDIQDMERMVKKMEIEGFGVDTISSNMILSSYGAYNALPKMVPWLQKMKALEIPFSIRTYNCVLNSCPMIMSFVRGSGGFPVSVSELVNVLDEAEALLVKELVESSSVLDEAMEWDDLELKLDLHGMHSGSAYLIMLQWIEEMKSRFRVEECVVPAQITVVCGTGKHSSVRGESPVKTLSKAMMVQMKSPMRIDRKNIGCFIAKGQVVRNWLIQSLD
ncbi:hypothetical protein ERO13_A03G206400v2 [Gossypium hirsutum]|nr:hypothetical protein ERO13_A03G206400v2 [Gossypium hirsutum]